MSNCLFCKFVSKEIPTQVVFEDESCLAFEDIHPKAPVHTLIVPKRHIESLNAAGAQDENLLGHLLLIAQQLARLKGVADSGYRAVINSGPDGGQSVFHVHIHLMGGRSMAWPPG
jgi:histidine triad (HIT) family protein